MKLKSKVILPVFLIGMTVCSCDESQGAEDVETDEAPVETVDSEPESDVEPLAETTNDGVENENWQINNYAVHLIGENIANSAEETNGRPGNMWFYQILDIKGGFASVSGAIEGWKEFAVWRMEDGDDLVGEMSVECGPACGYSFNFYKGRGGAITKQDEASLFPLQEIQEHKDYMVPRIIEKYPVEYPEDDQIVYNLPQKGTGMRVDVVVGADEVHVPILKLGWNKSGFFIEELFEEIEETYD